MTDLAQADARARAEAIDPETSFIVQAPAGSGKTSLLTQRFLRLLAGVARPEEIVAITFTRKAAAEMRHRIVTALAEATAEASAGAGEHELTTRRLALAALDNSRRRGWNLERHPARLHIQTIDGLNHWLAGRLPLTARLGLAPQLLDDARPVYEEAASRFSLRLEQQDETGDAILALSRLLDHRPARLAELLADMLARRELWLPKLFELLTVGNLRQDMERLLSAAVSVGLSRIRAMLDQPLGRELVGVLRAAAAEIPDGPLAALHGREGLPDASVAARAEWECVAQAVLTSKGQPRRSVTKAQGFPPGLRELKDHMQQLLARLDDTPRVCAALDAVRGLPPEGYSDAQWQRVEALCASLLPAAAELQALFGERGLVDHAAVAAAAREALGTEDAPSELALALDYRVRHVLVDEYQDTSPVQQRLLERLVAGWQPGDGHTLFCVGDPMQSVYGFREADVTLFMQAQVQGVGGVRLVPQALSRNFRSSVALVRWVNDAFAKLLPTAADYERGAVPYTSSEGTRSGEAGAGVSVHPLLERDDVAAAAKVADVVVDSLAQVRRLDEEVGAPEPRTIAVLVRARRLLPPIIAELKRRGIEYRGVELEGLSDRAAVRDLLALTRALLHPGDRTAWLAVLRAPWCGLTLPDLHALAADDDESGIGERLRDAEVLGRVTPEGRQRIARLLPTVATAAADLGRRPLGSVVKACWLGLHGPATLEDESDLENAETCFVALDALTAEAGCLPPASDVEAAVAGLMASPVGSTTARVQLMTIHKAKGLEFDTVIVPGLERTVPSAERRLLYWTPVAVEDGPRGIVLAGRGEPGAQAAGDRLERWMRGLERDRERLELGRIAYVAATRARRCLHLIGTAGLSWRDPEIPVLKSPPAGSLLAFFWPVISDTFADALERQRGDGELSAPAGDTAPRRAAPPLLRLPADFQPPATLPAVRGMAPGAVAVAATAIRPEFEWAGEEAIAIGTVVHALLEELGRHRLPPSTLRGQPARWRNMLERLGLPAARHGSAVSRIALAVDKLAVSSMAGRLLDPGADQAASELALTAWLDGEFVSIKIDRSFVDESGVRWIVDWKTGSHEGADAEQFLASEAARYAPQLARYARVMRLYDPRPQCVGLYFPLLDAWQEVDIGRNPLAGS